MAKGHLLRTPDRRKTTPLQKEAKIIRGIDRKTHKFVSFFEGHLLLSIGKIRKTTCTPYKVKAKFSIIAFLLRLYNSSVFL